MILSKIWKLVATARLAILGDRGGITGLEDWYYIGYLPAIGNRLNRSMSTGKIVLTACLTEHMAICTVWPRGSFQLL